ncbi:hypothetical protein N0V82_000768 [Gnomoniopsis sp. IMI 355080]|nr:hypothetical protein N0V82_000768 [Gnomoniopsis sp. IMI 355080]
MIGNTRMEPAARNSQPSPQRGDKRRAESPASTEPVPKRQQNAVPPASQPKEASVGALGGGSTSDASGPQDPRRDRYQSFIEAFTEDEFMNLLQDDQESVEKWSREYAAETERRKGLTPAARLREDGDALLPQLREAKAEITLQQTPRSNNGGARCRAEDDCLVKRAAEDSGKNFPYLYDPKMIKDDVRIHIDQGAAHFYYRHLYYHVACFEAMVDLAPLVPDLFSLDTQPHKGDFYWIPQWGVMVRKWFAHRGQINLGKIEEYIAAELTHDEQHCDDIEQWEEVHKSRGCGKRFELGALCDCPPRPERPERPVLRDYVATTRDEGCSLADIVHHRYCDEMKQSRMVWREGTTVHIETDYPENEPGDETGDQEPEENENTKIAEARVLLETYLSIVAGGEILAGGRALTALITPMEKMISSLAVLDTQDESPESTRAVPGTAMDSDSPTSHAPQPSLEGLPAEIQRLILFKVPTFQALGALVHASPQMHRVYTVDRLPILRNWLIQRLGVLADAYAAYFSGTLSFQQSRDEPMLWDFLSNYEQRRADPADLAGQLSLDDIVGMVCFHNSYIEPLTERYAASALASMPSLAEASPTAQPLSTTEMRRIQRAMYRLQVFGNACGFKGEGSSSRRIQTDVERLRVLSMFPPWEAEEILCIHEFAKEKYSSVFQLVAWDLDEERNPKFRQIEMTDVNDNLLLISEAGNINKRSRDAVLRHGLPLLSDVLNTEDHDQLAEITRAAIIAGVDASDGIENWIDDATWDDKQIQRREQWYTHHDFAQDHRQKMPFEGDVLASPPLAWVLFWQAEYSNLIGRSYTTKPLRRAGFVMWDASRWDSVGKEFIEEEWYSRWGGLSGDPRIDDYDPSVVDM